MEAPRNFKVFEDCGSEKCIQAAVMGTDHTYRRIDDTLWPFFWFEFGPYVLGPERVKTSCP